MGEGGRGAPSRHVLVAMSYICKVVNTPFWEQPAMKQLVANDARRRNAAMQTGLWHRRQNSPDAVAKLKTCREL
jgi:hypothetical protein